ncbi:MAG: YibE/F family protein [Vibrio sp.]
MRGVILALAVMISFLGFRLLDRPDRQDSMEAKGTVISVDNSRMTVIGSNRIGEQRVMITTSGFEQPIEATNHLSGSLEYDEYYQPGDNVLFVYQSNSQGKPILARTLAHYRLDILTGLLTVFALGLIIYARRVGVRALISFAGSLAIIWYWLIPALLSGTNPLIATTSTVCLLSGLIIFSVAGFTVKGISAFLGTLTGLAITTLLCIVVSRWLKLDGMTQPLAQVVLFETGMHLNMLNIYFAAVIIGASGAAMDVAMEMAATLEELKANTPNLHRNELVQSGFKVGSAVIGTMTTTLLLAYSGGFLTMLMLFMSRDASLLQILNMKLVAAEISRTLVGSISMLLVAPFTAWIAAYLLCRSPSTNLNWKNKFQH